MDILSLYYTKNCLDATLPLIITCQIFAMILKIITNPFFMKSNFVDYIKQKKLFPNVPIASNDWGQSLNSSFRQSDTLAPAHYN